MKYLIIGDVHGVWSDFGIHIKNVINRGFEFDAIIQCGDFGIYPDYIKTLHQMLHRIQFDKPIYFVDGNHEDHEYLHRSIKKFSKWNIHYQNRSSITILEDGTKIGWLGGAFNVDRPQYITQTTCNFPTTIDINNMVNNIIDHNGIDLMVTHSCPSNIGINLAGLPCFHIAAQHFIKPLGYDVAPIHDAGDCQLTQLWNALKVEHRPKIWVFGHFHTDYITTVDTTTFCCVGHCTSAGINRMPRMYFYDSTTKEFFS
jgi:predicted phosphodiesterase